MHPFLDELLESPSPPLRPRGDGQRTGHGEADVRMFVRTRRGLSDNIAENDDPTLADQPNFLGQTPFYYFASTGQSRLMPPALLDNCC